MNDKQVLRGGIIGCGFFSQFHIEAWRRMPGVDLAAACDLTAERAQAAAPQAYTSPEEMLDREQLDFVDIATRPDSHLPLLRLAASRGIPAICQKPMAPSWDDCVAIGTLAESPGARIMIHENWRWQPWYRAAKEVIRSGALGNVVGYRFRTVKRDGLGDAPYPDQPYFSRMPRLLVYETIVHHIDTARFLFGEVSSLYAQLRRNNPIIAGEDQAQLLLRHDSGLQGGIDGHRFADTVPPGGPVMGETWVEGDRAVLHVQPAGDLLLQGKLVWKNTISSGYRGDSVYATQQHFVESLRSGSSFETGVATYLRTVALVEAAYLSAREGRAVQPVK